MLDPIWALHILRRILAEMIAAPLAELCVYLFPKCPDECAAGVLIVMMACYLFIGV
jgi:uncharacterized membrane protein YgaE (UPF0421/DUF939 family)